MFADAMSMIGSTPVDTFWSEQGPFVLLLDGVCVRGAKTGRAEQNTLKRQSKGRTAVCLNLDSQLFLLWRQTLIHKCVLKKIKIQSPLQDLKSVIGFYLLWLFVRLLNNSTINDLPKRGIIDEVGELGEAFPSSHTRHSTHLLLCCSYASVHVVYFMLVITHGHAGCTRMDMLAIKSSCHTKCCSTSDLLIKSPCRSTTSCNTLTHAIKLLPHGKL